MDFRVDTIASDILETLIRQREEKKFCDVKLRVNDDLLFAHRCILAGASEYFRTLFLDNFDEQSTETYDISSLNSKAIRLAIDFIYTGHIRISLQSVDEILKAADLLRISEIKRFCSNFLLSHLDLSNCIYIKSLTDQFNLEDIRPDVLKFLSPLMIDMFRGSDILEIPFEYVYPLVSDFQLSYVKETELLNFMFRWIHYNLAERKVYFEKLVPLCDFSYISPGYIRRNVSGCQPIMDALTSNQKKVIEVKLSQEAFPERTEDVLFCLSLRSRPGEEVRLVVYRISEDYWFTVQNAPEAHIFERVQSMICHQGSLYLLLLESTESKDRMWKLELDRGRWCPMPAPSKIAGQSRLVSHGNGLYVFDENGIIEKFDNMSEAWVSYSGPNFQEASNHTLYILPMPTDRYIYLLRGFTKPGHDKSERTFYLKVHRYDTNKYSWDGSYPIDAQENHQLEMEHFYAYSATPCSLVLKDALGVPRINYDLQKGKCTTTDFHLTTPSFVHEIFGSVEYQKRMYFSGKIGTSRPMFMFYDHGSNRFKYVKPPPCFISGLLCHGIAPRTICSTLTKDKTDEE